MMQVSAFAYIIVYPSHVGTCFISDLVLPPTVLDRSPLMISDTLGEVVLVIDRCSHVVADIDPRACASQVGYPAIDISSDWHSFHTMRIAETKEG